MSKVDELCGELTANGEPCNMQKGHAAKFHRHREYKPPVEWIIKNKGTHKVLETGNGRMELGYAMSRWLKKGLTITIDVEP